MSSAVSVKMSAGVLHDPAVEQRHPGHVAEPLDVQRRRASRTRTATRRCGSGSRGFGQRWSASPGGRTSSVPHEGHVVGNFHVRAPFLRLASTGPTISGITSPARRTITVSPSRTSLRATSSSLCSVAYVIVTPPTTHRLEHRERRHLARASGVHVDLPQQRGALLGRELVRDRPAGRVARRAELLLQRDLVDLDHRRRRSPSRRCDGAPPSARGSAITPSTSCLTSEVGATGQPGVAAPRPGSPSATRTGRPPRTRTSAPTAPAAGEAVIFGSFWRSDPAAALRGFANGRFSAASSSSFRRLERPDRQVDLAADLEVGGRVLHAAGAGGRCAPCGRWP